MANYCYNHMTIDTNNKDDFHKLLQFFGSYKEYDTFSDWCDYLNTGLIKKDGKDQHEGLYLYGTRWWDFTVESSETYLGDFDGTINVYGDSAWAPPLGLAELISKAFDCEVHIEFSESGMDFAGIYTYSKGNAITQKDYRYNEFQYLEVDTDYSVDQIKELIKDEVYEDVDDLRADISYMNAEDIEHLADIFNKSKV